MITLIPTYTKDQHVALRAAARYVSAKVTSDTLIDGRYGWITLDASSDQLTEIAHACAFAGVIH